MLNSSFRKYIAAILLTAIAFGTTICAVHNFANHDSKISKDNHDSQDCALYLAFLLQENLLLFNSANFAALSLLFIAIYLFRSQNRIVSFRISNHTRAPPYFS